MILRGDCLFVKCYGNKLSAEVQGEDISPQGLHFSPAKSIKS